jgi:DNA-binding NarL/FixJ family response regulator
VNTAGPNARRRVLIADNSADLAQALVEIIGSDAQLEVVDYVLSGAAALERARHGGADVLVLDLGLPDCSGFEVLERLQADSPSLKVIIYTGHSSPELAAQARRKGAAACIVKDGTFDALLAAIHSA